MRASAVWWALLLLGTTGAHAATEDMDFIAEHVPEAAAALGFETGLLRDPERRARALLGRV